LMTAIVLRCGKFPIPAQPAAFNWVYRE
jgi:hypothetical protein